MTARIFLTLVALSFPALHAATPPEAESSKLTAWTLLRDSKYVWLPVRFGGEQSKIDWKDSWSPKDL